MTTLRDIVKILIHEVKKREAREAALTEALHGLFNEPQGCPMCDAGKLRDQAKEHWPDCPWLIAKAALAAVRGER